VALGVVFQHSPEVLLVHLEKPGPALDGLVGKRLMVGAADADVLAFLLKKGLPLERMVVVPHTFRVQDLIEGRVDAMSAYSIDQPYFLERVGFPYQIFTPRAEGIDFYGDTLFTDEKELQAHPETVKAFRAASLHGWQYAMAHREEIVDLILSRYPRQWNRAQLQFEADQMVPLLQPDLIEMGYMNPERWQRIGDTFASLGMLPPGFSLKGFLYNPRPELDLLGMLRWAGLLLAVGAAISAYQIHRSNSKFRAIFNAANDAIFIHDLATGAILDVNRRTTEMYGFSRGDFRTLPFDALCGGVPPYTTEDALRWMRKAAEGPPQVFEWLAKDRSGRLFWVEVNMRRTIINGQGRLVVSVRDIAERKQAEEAIRASEEKFAKVFQSAPILVALSRLEDGTLMEVNDRYCRALGYSREELIGKSTLSLGIVLPEDREPRVRVLADLGSLQGVEFNLHAKNGQVIQCLFSAELITVGGETMLISMLTDITALKLAELERHRLQTEVEQMQKLESLGRLAGGVAHDMNNVLGAILALASTQVASLPGGSPVQSSLETICAAAARGSDLVKRLLAFSRKAPGEKHQLNLNALLLEVARLLERTTLAKVHLEMDLAPDLHPILGDGSELTHAFVNICVNAVDAMSDGGTLIFRTGNLGLNEVQAIVEDNGCGMPRDVLDRALDPFFTTKPPGEGTGLGLSLVFRTVNAHGGHLRIRSEPGRGTWVTMTFPATVPQTPQAREGDPCQGPEVEMPALQVLLVDDDELIQTSTRMMVEALGHTVTSCLDGEAALQLLAQGFRPDAVILDLNMPGLGGKGTLPRLRGLCPQVPVMLSTGRADQEALDLAASVPLVTLLPKPYSFEALRTRFRQLVQQA